MTLPKPKTVRAWGFAWLSSDCWRTIALPTRAEARRTRRSYAESVPVGPVVRIEVPAPKERKR